MLALSLSFIILPSRDAASRSISFNALLMGLEVRSVVLAGTGVGVVAFSSVAQYLVVAKAGVASSQWWIR